MASVAMRGSYDAVIVGARCAGPATAIALAREFGDLFTRAIEPSAFDTPERLARWLG